MMIIVEENSKEMEVFQLQESLPIENRRRQSSFQETTSAKIQLTWKDVTITAPPKTRLCK